VDNTTDVKEYLIVYAAVYAPSNQLLQIARLEHERSQLVIGEYIIIVHGFHHFRVTGARERRQSDPRGLTGIEFIVANVLSVSQT
jgi:hypothetical protein